MRMKFKPWAKEYVQTNREIFVQDNEHLEEYLDGAKIVHLELGSGKGRFIHTIAKNNPGIKYIGIERFDSVIVYAGAKLEE